MAFSLIEKINVQKEKDREVQKPIGSLNEIPVIDLSDKIVHSSFSFEFSFQEELSDFKSDVIKEGKRYSLPNKEYKFFLRIIDEISKIKPFIDKASKDYLLKKSLIWIVDVFINKVATTDLLSFLLDEINNDSQKRVYYFFVLNLSVEKSFKIGDVEFMYFSSDFFDKCWESFKESENWSEEAFDKIFRKHQGKVFASYVVDAEPIKGEQEAYLKSCEAVDVLKLFTDTVVMPKKRCLVDLERRLNINFSSESLSRPINNPFEFTISQKANNNPFDINRRRFELLEESSLPIFSDFVAKQKKNEFESIIKNAINYLGNAIAIEDIHMRVSQMIMIIESLFLKEEEKGQLTVKVKKRFPLFRFPNSLENRLECSRVLNEMYNIRHKMVHQAKRLYIDITDLRTFQIILVEALSHLISVGDKYQTKDSFIDTLP